MRPFSAIKYVYGSSVITAYGGVAAGGKTATYPAEEYDSFIPVSDHPEFPSASACFCYAFSQALRLWFDSDELGAVVRPDCCSVCSVCSVRPPAPQTQLHSVAHDNNLVRSHACGKRVNHVMLSFMLSFWGTATEQACVLLQLPVAAGSSVNEPGLSPKSNITIVFPTFTAFARDCAQSRVDAGLHFPFAVEAAKDICTAFGTEAYKYMKKLVDGTAPVAKPAQGRPVSSLPTRGKGKGRGRGGPSLLTRP